ncbi:MAG: flavin reductase [Nitrososphaerota archaeon]|nr:flavin reductase [Nitrososphaerota archaeon]MDG7023800.1 flavin reductase [Nitrososphaerota archaeon]
MKVEPSLIHRLFYPQVPLVMACQYRGRVSAMPVVSYASVSDSPPMVAVSCTPGGFTCRLAQKAGSFSLSLLDRRHLKALARLATVSGAKVKDKLTDAGLEHSEGAGLKVPVIKGSHATLECELKSKNRTGDHLLLVAQVRAARSTGAFTDFWDYSQYDPILYTGWKDGMTTYRSA